jgi:hypothetical protein
MTRLFALVSLLALVGWGLARAVPSVPAWAWTLGLLVLFFWIGSRVNRAWRRNIADELARHFAEHHPEIVIVERQPHQWKVRVPGVDEPGDLSLFRLYGTIAKMKITSGDHEARREQYEILARALKESRSLADATLASSGERILLRLLSPAQRAAEPFASFPGTPVGDTGLTAIYVLDGESSVAYIAEPVRAKLGLDVTALHERAVENLLAKLPEDAVRAALDGEKKMTLVKSMDTYDAARLLALPRRLREGEELAALVPDRDTLMLVAVPADGDWSSLRKLAKTVPADEPRLFDHPLRVSRDGIVAID